MPPPPPGYATDIDNTSLSYITLNWIPQSDQIGTQIFCAIAYAK